MRFRILLYIWLWSIQLTYAIAAVVLLGFSQPNPDETLTYVITGFALPGILAAAPLAGLYGLWRRREGGRTVFIFASLGIGAAWAIIFILLIYVFHPVGTAIGTDSRQITGILACLFIAITALSLVGFILHWT